MEYFMAIMLCILWLGGSYSMTVRVTGGVCQKMMGPLTFCEVRKVRTCLVHEASVGSGMRVLRPFHKPEGHILRSAFCSPDREVSGNLYSEQNRSRHHEVVKSWNFLFLDLCKLQSGNTLSTSFCKWASHT